MRVRHIPADRYDRRLGPRPDPPSAGLANGPALMARGRDAIAIVGSRTASRLTRAAGYFGTSLPGLVAERLAPGIAGRLARDLGPITLVSGTNGKTTTSRLLATILERTGRRVLANPSGANLAQAISTALTARASLTGGGLRRAGAFGVFEVDEAALPLVARELPVAQLVLTNLFRDQLDRFGETNEIVRRWGAMLPALEPEARVVYCADDPRLAALAASRPTGNAYNAAAAVAAAVGLGVARDAAVAGLAEASAPFGRWEALEIDGRQVVLSLVKNPASLDEVTRVGADAAVDAVLFAVNDTYADGRDVSWYWDVNPAALLAGRLFAVSGTRAADLQLRLKYQLVDEPGSELPGLVGTFERPADGLARLVAVTPPGGTVLVAATYTALLGLRSELVARGLVRAMPT